MLIQAKVIRQTKSGVEVETRKDCGGCSICQPAKPETFMIKTHRKYKKGRIVNIELNTGYFWRALSLLICLPLITLVIVLSFLLRFGFSEILAAIISLAICLLEYIGIYFYDRTIKTEDLYRIV